MHLYKLVTKKTNYNHNYYSNFNPNFYTNITRWNNVLVRPTN